MEFTSNRYLITEIVRPKSLFVTDIKAKVGDELEFVIQVELRKNSSGPVYSSQITVSYKDFLNCFSSPSCYFRHIIILGLLKNN